MKISTFVLLFLLGFAPILQAQQNTEARLLRFPAVHNNQVVFTHAGDLYTVERAGGVARKLTDHVGYEMFPHFSHDGSKIAFTGQYDGNTEVFVMPSEGGDMKRITYTATLGRDDIGDRMGPNNIVMAWTPDDQFVVYRSRKNSFNSFKGQLFKAPLTGELSEQLPFSVGGWCSYSADGKKFAHNRVFREFRTWKYYRGGMADDVWVYDSESEKTENITNNPAQDIFPMYWKDKVYFFSDRARTMNMYEYDSRTKETRQVTNFTEFDCKFPSLGENEIAFENGGYIYIYDLVAQKQEKVNVTFNEPFSGGREVRRDATENISSWNVSPDGKRLVIAARGDVYTVPAKEGVTRNLTQSSGAHDRSASWSPDGKWIAFISDRTGEDELYVQAQDGKTAARQLTKNGTNYKYAPKWAPDSKHLIYSDREQKLYLFNSQNGAQTTVYESKEWEMHDFDFSPDTKWIAVTLSKVQGNSTVALYSIESKEMIQITDGWYSANRPRFSEDGRFLFFISDRDFNPIYSSTEWNHAYDKMSKVYFVALTEDAKSPFALKNDEVQLGSEDAAQATEIPSNIDINPNNIAARIEALPIDAGHYWSLQTVKGGLYYLNAGDGPAQLKFFDLEEKEEKVLGKYGGYRISADGKKIVIRKGSSFYVENLSKGELETKNKVNTDNMKVLVDQREEWNQVYYESWRQFRDFFYDPGMQGVDWIAMRDKYKVLLPHVHHRNDLTYIIGELIGELNIGHAYCGGGERPELERVKMGLLGATFSRDNSGYYKIDHIIGGANWTTRLRSPLMDNGLNISEGEFIIAINGNSVKDMENIYQGLIGMADKTIELTVNKTGSDKGARTVLVKPIADESKLYYYEWVEANKAKVDELSGGQIGYLHIPDMGPDGLNQFARYFYPQLDKKALIIDDRGNGGGNVSPMIIERLRRELSMVRQVRNSDAPRTKPAQMLNGPKVCLINQYSASDGDLFPYQFRFHGLGTIIGVRSWGGVVGIRGTRPFIDGGYVRVPEFSHYAADGSEWVIEGVGVSPDVELENDPHDVYGGNDAQLQKAVDMLLEQIKTQWKALPPPPAFPDKTH